MKECDNCKDFDCINCEIPNIEPEECEYCRKKCEEKGIEYEFNVIWDKDELWKCEHCGNPV